MWNAALVDPSLKKSGQAASLTNLTLVSNFQIISKLTERAVSDQTADHLSRLGLYPSLQSAYRAGHSTETALLKVQNDMLLAMDRQHVTFLVLLDLSVAFDTLDHEALLRRFEVTYGITGTAPQWFRSYLTGKSQRVYINRTYSDDFPQALYFSRCVQVNSSRGCQGSSPIKCSCLCRRHLDIFLFQAGFSCRGARNYHCSSRLHYSY